MRILHLFANYKWTGPADPAIRLAAEQRRAGADVSFALPMWHHPGAEERVRRELLRQQLRIKRDAKNLAGGARQPNK